MADSTISIDDVRYVARLAHIQMSDAEAGKLRGELDEILGYVRQLDSLDTDGVEPTYQVTGLSNVMRGDVVVDYGVPSEALLSLAPHAQDGQIKVPKVL